MAVDTSPIDISPSCVDSVNLVSGRSLRARKIVDSVILHGRTFYKVQWEDAWIDAEHLTHCHELIKKFQEEQPHVSGMKSTNSASTSSEVQTGCILHIQARDGIPDAALAPSHSLNDQAVAGNQESPSNSALPSMKWEQRTEIPDFQRDEEPGKVVQIFAQAPSSVNRSRTFVKRDGSFTFPDRHSVFDKKPYSRRRRQPFEMYKCQFCAVEFVHRTHLKIHERVHTGEKPHRCDECGRSFAQKGNLHVHMKIHTGEKKYICQYCGKAFITGPQLFVHERTHFNPKPRHHATARSDSSGFTQVYRAGAFESRYFGDDGRDHVIAAACNEPARSEASSSFELTRPPVYGPRSEGVERLVADASSAGMEDRKFAFGMKEGDSLPSDVLLIRNSAQPESGYPSEQHLHEPEPLVMILEDSSPVRALDSSPEETEASRHVELNLRHGLRLPTSSVARPHFQPQPSGITSSHFVRPNELLKF